MKLEILYPELSGLFGDAMNAELILRALPETEAVRTPLKARPAFADGGADIIYLGSMTERSQEFCAQALMPYRDEFYAEIDKGTVFLITGNALELFGQYIENEDGTGFDTLGLFDFRVKRRMLTRYNSLYLGKFGEMELVGFKSQFSHMYGDPGADALFTTLRGAGHAQNIAPEGLRRNNFMATYVLGPLLVLNPPFFRYLLELLGFPGREIPFERAAFDAYEQRLREFRDPKTVETF